MVLPLGKEMTREYNIINVGSFTINAGVLVVRPFGDVAPRECSVINTESVTINYETSVVL